MHTETYKLQYPIEYNGEAISELTIRRPKIRDIKRFEALKVPDMDKAIRMLSDLAEIEPGAIEELDAIDFDGASQVIAGFLPEEFPGRTNS